MRHWKLLAVVLGVVLLVAVVPPILKLTHKDEWVGGPNDFPIDPNADEYFSHFPVKLEDFASPVKMYGLWPYGIKGSNSSSHNEGHPGWDFELKKGAKVYAVSDLYIAQIHDGDTKSGGQALKVIEAYANLKSGRYHIVYHSVANLEKGVVEGATISAGKPLAEAGFLLSEDTTMIHFGVFRPRDSVGVCPTPYFSEDLLPIIKEVVARSVNMETGKPYESACVGKISRELYEQNFPDRVQYLEGGEEWE